MFTTEGTMSVKKDGKPDISEKEKALEAALNQIQKQFGQGAIRWAKGSAFRISMLSRRAP